MNTDKDWIDELLDSWMAHRFSINPIIETSINPHSENPCLSVSIRGYSQISDGFMSRNERFHNDPGDQITQRANDEHDEITGLGRLLEVITKSSFEKLDENAANSTRCRANARDRSHGLFGKHV